ncbi:7662_t:CDS:1 [Ambispora leptoticha]|uniref:7662_t:CDS:1 n=1 Tax=Ambispora leptoticha TaxID=144679 RepID=A0A9N8ZUJ0_9GLOM|nr:7662_t:CDS:1 [Ambispora leptoticha]
MPRQSIHAELKIPKDLFDNMKERLGNITEIFFIKSDPLTSEQMLDLLEPKTLLSSDHINAYFSMLNSRHDHIYGLSTYFYTRLISSDNSYEYEAVARWTKNTRIFKKEMVFVPINMDQVHWILAVIWMGTRKIQIWDSLGHSHHKDSVGTWLNKYLKDEYDHKEYNVNHHNDMHQLEDDDKKDKNENSIRTIGHSNNDNTRQSVIYMTRSNYSISSNNSHRQDNTINNHPTQSKKFTYNTRSQYNKLSDKGAHEENIIDEWKDFKVVDQWVQERGPQTDGSSCGVFVCLIAKLLTDGKTEEQIKEIIFEKDAALNYRKVMTLEIYDYAIRNNTVTSAE